MQEAEITEEMLKINLAKDYIDIGYKQNAFDLLSEVVLEASDKEKQLAEELIKKINVR